MAAETVTATMLRHAAMDYLARREHSRHELQSKLLRRFDNVEQTILAAELDRLAEERLQCDQRFAESLVRSRLQRRHGPLRVRQELAIRGVSAALIDEALRQVDAECWQVLASEAVTMRFGTAPPGERKEWLRRARFLQRRGFSSEQIQNALTRQAS